MRVIDWKYERHTIRHYPLTYVVVPLAYLGIWLVEAAIWPFRKAVTLKPRFGVAKNR